MDINRTKYSENWTDKYCLTGSTTQYGQCLCWDYRVKGTAQMILDRTYATKICEYWSVYIWDEISNIMDTNFS